MWELEKLKRFYYNGKSISNNYICAYKNGHAYIIITKVASSSPRWKLYNVQCWNSSPSLNYISKTGPQKFLQFLFQIGCMTETEHFPPNVAKTQSVFDRFQMVHPVLTSSNLVCFFLQNSKSCSRSYLISEYRCCSLWINNSSSQACFTSSGSSDSFSGKKILKNHSFFFKN